MVGCPIDVQTPSRPVTPNLIFLQPPSPSNPTHSLPASPQPETINANNPLPTSIPPQANIQQELLKLVQTLQAQNHPPCTTTSNVDPLNAPASSSSSSILNKVKLGRSIYDVIQDAHLLPLAINEELRYMRHVKLWFFTNDGLEKTRLAKEKTGRYNTS